MRYGQRSAIASMAATIASRYVPWNKFAQAGRETKLAARATLRAPALAELARLDDPGFRALFAKSAVKRIGRARFLRNVLIAIGNAGDAALVPEAERLLDDASPIVRGAAIWALRRLDRARLRREQRSGARPKPMWTSLPNGTRPAGNEAPIMRPVMRP